MQRLIDKDLLKWKTNSGRKPLILRGAWQVGKTWTVQNFEDNYYQGPLHLIDFEKNLDIKRILSELEIFIGASINPDKDLLFFDEIQSCPKALMSLRYFYEDFSDIHIISAGSLLEFALEEDPFPVGRVQFLSITPLSFAEFLMGIGKDKLAKIVLGKPQVLAENIHQLILDELKNYFFIGGMPECVKIYKDSQAKRCIRGSITTYFRLKRRFFQICSAL